MKKRHISPIAATLLTTALLGLGALPALADNPIDSLLNDANSQNLDGHQFQLEVLAYPPAPISAETGYDSANGKTYYVGLTQGILTDLTAGQSSDPFYMFCVDFNDDINQLPAFYNIIIQGLTSAPIPNNLNNESLQNLQEAALLGANFGSTPSGFATDVDAQFDIWNLSNPTAGIPTTDGSGAMQTLLDAAIAGQANPNTSFANSYLFDIDPPPGAQGSQAFMPVTMGGFNNSNEPPTPEPGTLATLGLALIGLGSLKLRRAKR